MLNTTANQANEGGISRGGVSGRGVPRGAFSSEFLAIIQKHENNQGPTNDVQGNFNQGSTAFHRGNSDRGSFQRASRGMNQRSAFQSKPPGTHVPATPSFLPNSLFYAVPSNTSAEIRAGFENGPDNNGNFGGGPGMSGFQQPSNGNFPRFQISVARGGLSSRATFNNNGSSSNFQQPHNDYYDSNRGGLTPRSFTRGGGFDRGGFTRGTYNNNGSSTTFRQSNNDNSGGFTRGGFDRGGYSRGGRGGHSVPYGSRDEFNNASNFGNGSVTKQQHDGVRIQHEAEIPGVLPVTEEDKLVFGEEFGKKLADQKLPRNRAENGFAPSVREVDDIFEEDEKYAADYDTVTNEDEQIVVEGLKKPLPDAETWEECCLYRQIRKNIRRANYTRPRKIQSAAIPIIVKGYDIQVTAETGTGKTSAYLLPILQKCHEAKRDGTFESMPYVPYAIILGPTRELVKQCFEQACKFADGTGITVAKAYGEYTIHENKKELVGTCDIICITPGRLLDFVRRRWILLHEMKFLVFDEGDQLLSEGFVKTLDDAIIFSEPKIPRTHQTLVFSATFSQYASYNIGRYMRTDKTVYVKNKVTVPSQKCEQYFELVEKTGKFGVVLAYLRSEFDKVGKDIKKYPRTIVFCNQSIFCEKLALGLEKSEIPTIPLSGIRAQDLREDALKAFRDGEAPVLCVTNLASRGIDIKEVDLVINYDMPRDFETYVHRVGRTGRIRHGKAVSFVSREYDIPLLHQLKKAMEEAGHVIPKSLIDVIGDYDTTKSSQSFGFGFNGRGFGAATAEAGDVAVKEEMPGTSTLKADEKTSEDLKSGTDFVPAFNAPDEKKEDHVAVEKDEVVKHDIAPALPLVEQEQKNDISIVAEVELPSEEGTASVENKGIDVSGVKEDAMIETADVPTLEVKNDSGNAPSATNAASPDVPPQDETKVEAGAGTNELAPEVAAIVSAMKIFMERAPEDQKRLIAAALGTAASAQVKEVKPEPQSITDEKNSSGAMSELPAKESSISNQLSGSISVGRRGAETPPLLRIDDEKLNEEEKVKMPPPVFHPPPPSADDDDDGW